MLPSRSGSDYCPFAQTAVEVIEVSQVGEARRLGTALARTLAFDDIRVGKVALVITEMASNIVKHGGGGSLLLSHLEYGGVSGLEILALDKGPGMANLEACFRDGFSTAGTPGTGLGAIARSADFVSVYTIPSRPGAIGVQSKGGTAVLARFWVQPPTSTERLLELGTVCLPKPQETECGDGWAVHEESGRTLVMVADGLGHGPMAATASREAVRSMRAHGRLSPGEIIQASHAALRATRGASLGIAAMDLQARCMQFAGVGNVSGTIIAADGSRSMVSHNGTVGHEMRKVQEFRYPFPEGALLIMHSDGLATHWRLDHYPGLATREPALVAGILYRDHQRGRDDVTVLVLREARA